MKLHLTIPKNRSLFTGHGPGYVAVGGTAYHTPLLVTPEGTVSAWSVSDPGTLTIQAVQQWLEHRPEIVILGTGARQQFPDPSLLQPLYAARVGLEVMDTPAACRTYNILIAEDRRIMAAMWLP